MRRTCAVVILILFSSIISAAQVGGFLKQKADEVGRKGTSLLKGKAAGKADAERDRLDSVDFNYAISVIDNSGMLNIRDKGESLTKAAYTGSNMFLKDDNSATPAQRCRSLYETGKTAYQRRLFKVAEFYYLAAKTAYEAEGLTNNINYSKTWSDLGLLYATMGRLNAASQFTQQALDIREQTLGVNSFGYAASVNNRAVLYQDLAYFNEAEKDFEQAKSSVKSLKSEASQEYAIVLNNEAILFAEMGRFEEAIDNLNKAVSIIDAAKSKSAAIQLGLKSNLALLYQRTNKLAEAEAIYLKLEKELEGWFGTNNPYYAGVLNNLAMVYVQMNKPEKVEDYFKRAANLYKTKFGEESPSYAKVIGDQGWYYRRSKRYAEAEPLLVRALEIREKTLGTDHPDYVHSREELAILYWKTQKWEQAYNHYKVVMDKTIDFINKYFPPMSEAEKTKYWEVTYPRFQRYSNFALDASTAQPDIVKDLFDYQTATKALLLNSTSKVKSSILKSGNAQLIQDYLNWLDAKESLARYYSLSKEDIREQKVNLDSIERAANNMEKLLSERSKEFSSGYSTQKTSWSEIANALTDQEALVEIIHIRAYDNDFTADSRYLALVLTKGASAPRIAVMDNGNQLETRYAKFYRNSIQQKTPDEHSYTQYWSKVDPLLTGKKQVFISPDGVYNQINLNTLKDKSGAFVLNKYDIVIVGNSKDILSIKSRTVASKKEAFLLGFPDYGGSNVPALPGTKVELDAVSKLLKTGGYATRQYMERGATEAILKGVKAPGLLHIATHGYFLEDAELNDNGAVGISLENAQANPLLRSGILLAGAAGTMSGKASVNLSSNDNGVLTAYEAMNLDLNGTDLIILSACETGLGDVKAGEGVYGLQRAFLVAGANALIMSLWKVDDAATQQLMTNFYTNWIKSGNKLKAFKQAQTQLMAKYKEPYYWGAFVMMGL
jgi:CHAT domain-containing protein/Flp pilus assembly protein TadD